MAISWLKKAVFYIFLIISLLVFMEICLRIGALIRKDSCAFLNDDVIGYRMRPHIVFGSITTNEYGFNDIDHPLKQKKGYARAAFIGDSFTFGLVRKENFVFAVEQKALADGIKLETLNMGIPGADPEAYLKILKNDAVKMGCNTVAVVFFVGNDIIQSHPDFETRVNLGLPRMLLRYPWNIGLSLEYCYTYRIFRIGLRLIREHIRPKGEEGTFERENFLDIEKRLLPIYRKRCTPFICDCYAATLKIMQSLSIQAKESKMKFFVVLAPDEIQVNEALQADLFKTSRLNGSHYDFQLPQRIIKNYLDEQGVLCLDLLPAFKNQTKKTSLYIKQDTHWNKTGHDLAAEQIWNFMKENKLM